jgi:ribonucleoside-diphosphate reductase alpha chain
MSAFDSATEAVKQGGRRRGANMGVLRVDHPDILDFISAKQREDFLSNFNISVAATDDFMKAALSGGNYDLVNPRTGAKTGHLGAGQVLEAIASSSWQTGDPGIIFIDRVNEANPTPRLGAIEATNPCGEQPLLPYESCNLGSINISLLVEDGDFDWVRLGELVELGVRFLDDVIDANRFPLPEIEEITRGNRKIGLGVMGLAQALIKLGIRYDSEPALEKAHQLMQFISERAIEASEELGRQRGSFPNFEGSVWQERGHDAMRNATVTTIAPTGTISVIAGTTSGIEPLFAVSFVRDVMEGVHLLETNSEFEAAARQQGIYSEELMMDIARDGGIQGIEAIPDDIKNLFVTALDIEPEWHLRMQAAFQKHVDNAVSKTINLPRDAGIGEVHQALVRAWELGLKGVTVFRYGSKKQQVLYLSGDKDSIEGEHVRVGADYAGGCPAVDCEF